MAQRARRLPRIRTARGREKVATVMREFYRGKLRSASGAPVTDEAQAKAIAMSEGRAAEEGRPFRMRTFMGRRRLRPVPRRRGRRLRRSR